MVRRMAEEAFRDDQVRRRYEDHIAPINRLVDELSVTGRGWMPHVAPMYGGVRARLLSVLRDPGPKTQTGLGSGFLCMENDDATAEAISRLFADAGISADDIVPWNIYPWYINRAPTAEELSAGSEPLRKLIDLLPDLSVVMLHGVSAKAGWKRIERLHRSLIAARRLVIIPTYHTSRQAFRHPDPRVREARHTHLRNAFDEAARHLASVL